jgi:hypothetical protein
MDSFTTQQIQAMKSGGNEQYNTYIEQQGSTEGLSFSRNTPTKEKYDNPIAELYKLRLKARAEGRPEPTELPKREEKVSSSSSTTRPAGKQMSFVNTTPPPSFISSTISAYKLSIWASGSVIMDQLLSKHPLGLMMGLAGMVGTVAVSTVSGPAGKVCKCLIAFAGGVVGVVQPCHMGYQIRSQRLPAFDSSVNDYTKRCKEGRAKRNLGYEVFFPPNVSIGDSVDKALIFYPGFLVDHMSYARILGQLSDKGILVLLVNAEPSRVVSEVASVEHLKRLRHEITTLMGITVKEWLIGGHSLGGMACASLFAQRDFPTDISRLVQWAIPGESSDLSKSSILKSVLRISGTRDGVVKALDVKEAHSRTKFPANCDAQFESIVGGNHAGFAHYGPQKFPVPDWDRQGITLDQQHHKVVQWTARYILSGKKVQ